MMTVLQLLARRSLTSKLLLGFSILMAFMLAIGVVNLQIQRTQRDALRQLYDKELLGVSNAKDAQNYYLTMGRELRQAALAGPGKSRQAALVAVTEGDAGLRTEISALRERLFRTETKAALAEFELEYATYKSNVLKAAGLLEKGAEAEAAAYIASEEFRRPGAAANAALARLTAIKERGARATTEATIEASETAFQTTALALAAAMGLSLVIGGVIVASIRRPSEDLRQAVESIAAGALETQVPFIDYDNEIGSLARSVQVLQGASREMKNASWLKNHLAQCAQAMQTASSFTALTQAMFSHVAPLIQLGHGVFYVFEEDQRRLRLLSSYAFRERKSLSQYFALGQGLVGQCAMERAPITLLEPPADYVHIGSSLGAATPRTIHVIPILRNERLLGVLELASFQGFGTREQALIDGLMPLLATNLEILERSVKTNKLLDETRAQARLMQQQAAQLEEQTEELEAQQAALKDTEAWYRSIIESAPDGMLVCNERGIITLANPTLEAMFGYGEGELPGHAIEVLVPEAVRGAHVGLREGYASSGAMRAMGSVTRELRGVRRDGSSFAVEVGLSKLPTVGGRGSNVCASVRDITDRRAAEERMAALEERSRLILGSVNDGIVGLDAEGQLSFVNPAVTTLLGYSEAELLGQKMHALMHHTYPDGRHFPRAECAMYLTSVDGVARTVDNEVLWRKDGTALPVEYSTTPVYKDGALVGTVVAFRDITERRAAEEKLRMANFLSDQALDLTQSGHWHISLNTGDEFYNSSARAAAIFGDPPQPDWRYHLMNHWFANVEAGDKDAAARTFENFNAALAGTVPRYDAVYAYKRPVDGRVVWVHAIGQVVRDASGTPTDMYGVTVDITAAQLAEAQLVERMDELERFNRLTIDREERMIALKGEINALLADDGLAPKYRIVE